MTDMHPNEFRAHGAELIEWVAQYLDDPRRFPVFPQVKPGDLLARLPAAGPVEGEKMRAILDDFYQEILPAITHWNHPRFHAYFALSSTGPAILAELLNAALNANAMMWRSCPAATELEQTTLRWILDWLRLPTDWFGMILDSASSAVLHAIVAARQRASPEIRKTGGSGRLVVYVSEQTHSSVEKAAIVAGIGQENIRHLPVDGLFRLRPDALRQAIHEDHRAGRKPCLAVATVGTTSTAAIDPVDKIAAICREENVWLHVDGAYGGAVGIVPERRHLLNGVEHADSFVVNAHKWLLVPLDCTLFYTRHSQLLREAFALDAAYLQSDENAPVNYMDYGLALGRRFRALKLWFVLRWFGRGGLASIVREHIRLARCLAGQIAADVRFELIAPVDMGLVCFRLKSGDRATKALMDRLNSTGRFFLSHTVLRGKFILRVAIGNIRTTEEDVKELWRAVSLQ